MGGLARWLPLTFPTFLIGWLTISGVPPFAGFWSKGDVLTNVFAHNKILWALGVLTAILTAYYMSRLFILTFRGNERFRDVTHQHDPHEAPLAMTAPLLILAALSVLGGLLDLPWAHGFSLSHFLSPTFGYVAATPAQSTVLQTGLALVDVAAAVIGLFAAFTIWRNTVESPAFELPFFEHVWRWDDAYDAALGRPLERVAQASNDVVEDRIIDGLVEGLGGSVRRSGEGIRKLQAGMVRQYALAMVLGATVIVVYLVGRVR
jgi:NADH-quinone oxidoreductase subunit L